MNGRNIVAGLSVALQMGFCGGSMATLVTQTTNDVAGESSLDTGLHWSDGRAPSLTNDYVSSYHLRTPDLSTIDWVFTGKSLSLNTHGNLAYNGSGNCTITKNSLTHDGGSLRPSGTYGATGSGTRFVDDDLFEGTGRLDVQVNMMRGLALWLDASAFSGLEGGAAVALWPDLSGYGNDAAQTVSTNRPTFVAGTLNGRAVVRFDGTNDFMDGPANALTCRTVFAVCKLDPTAPTLSGLFASTAGADTNNIRAWSATSWNAPRNHANAADFCNNGRVFVDGLAGYEHGNRYHILFEEATTDVVLHYRLSQTFMNRSFKGDLAELLVYDRVLSLAERNQVGTYLEQKWGLDTAFDTNAVPATVPGLAYWVKADDLRLADNDPVSSWGSFAADYYVGLQGSVSAQPRFIAAGLGGRPAVRFDGGDRLDFGGIGGANWPTNSTTIFYVTRADAPTGNQFYQTTPDDDRNRFLSHYIWWGDGRTYFDFGDIHAGGRLDWSNMQPTAPTLMCYWQESGVGQKAFRNGGLIASDDDTSVFNPLGKSFSIGTGYQGDIAEFIVYNRALSVDERNRIESYLLSRYGIPTAATPGVFENVSEASEYTLVYSLSIPNMPNYLDGVLYDVDLHAYVTNFSRVAYYLEMQSGGGAVDYAWVAMDPFAADVGKIGVPTVPSGAFFQQNVSNMTVLSSVAAVVNGTNLASGNIEFWPCNYVSNNTAGVPNASGITYDFGDSPVAGNYGSMQIHNHDSTAKQTILAFNNWGGHAGYADVGIGNDPNTTRAGYNPDWTFAYNAAGYTVKTLQVFAKLSDDSAAPVIARAVAQPWGTNIVVTFSKPLEDSATNAAFYALSGGLTVLGATLDSCTRVNVILATTPMAPGRLYTLTVNGVRDITPAHLPIAPYSTVTFELRYPVIHVHDAITSSDVWAGSRVYVVDGDVTVASGATLTIQPGAILKFVAGTSLIVNSGGTLSAVGNRAQPIVFTSFKDDAYGGDNNGDGGGTLPQPGDWGKVGVNGGVARMEHVSILYSSKNGTTGAINMNGGSVVFVNGVIAHGLYDAVGVESGSFYMTNSVIADCLLAFRHWPRDPIVNCVVYDVGRITQGGGQNFVNCSFVRVTDVYEAFGWSSTYRYCHFYNPPGVGPQSAQPVGSHGNIWGDPLFRDAAHGDYSLRPGSPLIDAGDGTVGSVLDHFGQPRVDDPYMPNSGVAGADGACPDIGIYELADGAASDVDLVPAWVRGPEQATAGERVVVRWQTVNSGTATAAGPWRDELALVAADGALGDQTVVLGAHLVDTALAPGAGRELAASFVVPPLPAGNWRVQVRVNAFREVFEGTNAANNVALSAATVAVGAPTLAVGSTAVTLAAGGSAGFRVTGLTSAGGSVIVTAGAGVRLFGASGYMPSEAGHQWSATDLGDGRLLLVLPAATDPASMFVTLTNEGGAEAQVGVDVRVAAPDLYGVSRNRFPNTADAAFSIYGAGWSGRAAVQLVRAGGGSVDATSLDATTPGELRVVVPMRGKSAGMYDVTVTEGGQSRTLANAVELTSAGRGPQWFCNLHMPSAGRAGREYTGRIEYGNTGDTELPAPYVRVFPDTAGIPLRFDDKDAWRMDSLEFMAASASFPAGMLKPGERRSVSFKYFIPSTALGRVSLRYSFTLDSAADFPWANNAQYMRPSWMSDEMWGFVLMSLRGRIGETWNDYLARMRADLDYLARMGQPTVRVATLWQMEINAALGVDGGPAVLASATDARRAGRVLDVAFSRWYGAALHQRFKTGILGYGWTHNYDVRLERNAAGDEARIHYPGGATRSFRKPVVPEYMGDILRYQNLAPCVFLAFPWWLSPDTTDRGRYYEYAATCTLWERNGTTITFDKTTGRIRTITEPRGSSLGLTYTGDQLTRVTHSDGQWLAFAYSGGQLASVTDDAGRVTSYSYTGPLLTSVTAYDGRITRYAYLSAAGTITDKALNQVTYPDHTTLDILYDPWGRPEAVSRNGSEQTVVVAREGVGTLSMVNADGAVSRVNHGAYGETLAAADPLNRLMRYTYDDTTRQVTSITAPGGQRTTIAYDSLLNPVRVVSPLGFATELAYTYYDDLASFTDARGQRVGYSYGNGNWWTLNRIAYPDGSQERFTHSARNDVETWVNRRGQTVSYAYDPLGRMTRKEWPDGRVFTYAYDGRGNLTNATDSLTGAVALSYDAGERLTGIAYPGGRGFTFAYDAAGRRVRRTAEDGHELRYEYDALGRFSALKDKDDALYIRYAYDGTVGRLARQDRGNGTYTLYAYDLAGQLTGLTHHAPGGALLQQFAYAYDVNGLRTNMTTLAGSHNYRYDNVGQLLSATAPAAATESFTYDPVGNRLTSGGSTTYAVNNLNQYTRAGTTTFAYDAAGNLIRRIEPAGVTTNVYDVENRLVGVIRPDGTTWSCQYDALGNRVEVNDNGVVRRYVYDSVGLTDLAAEYDAGGALIRRYIHGGWLVADETGAGVRRYYHADALSSTRLLTDASGVVIATRDYSVFGLIKTATGEATPFGYVGGLGVMQDSTGLLFMRNRYYASGEGRFVQADPIGINAGDVNWYRYVGNMATMMVDLSGGKRTSPGTGFVASGRAATVGGVSGRVVALTKAILMVNSVMQQVGGMTPYVALGDLGEALLGYRDYGSFGGDYYNTKAPSKYSDPRRLPSEQDNPHPLSRTEPSGFCPR